MSSEAFPTGTREQLAAVNHRIVADGEVLPIVRTRDGSLVQTGTVAAMLHNVARYNLGERGEIEDALVLAVPTLVKVGLFELFGPDDWIQGNNPGRAFVGAHARRFIQAQA